MLSKSASAPYWGLDISNSSIKAASLLKRGNKHLLKNYGTKSLPAGCFEQGKIINEDAIVKTIKETLAQTKGQKMRSKFVKTCLPEKHTFIKVISIPKMDDKEIPEAVEWTAEHHLPYALEEIYFDWQVLKHQPDKKNIQIIIGAASRDAVDDYTRLLKKAGLTPLALEIESVVLSRVMISDDMINKDEAVGLIDIGAEHSSFIVYSLGTVQFTYQLDLSGYKITQTISEKLSLSKEQAEAAKIICGVDDEKCQGGIKVILDKELKIFMEKIKTAIRYYENHITTALPIKKIILTGGGSNMKRLSTYLNKNLGIEITKGNPQLFLDQKDGLKIPKKEIMHYSTALGLAFNINYHA